MVEYKVVRVSKEEFSADPAKYIKMSAGTTQVVIEGDDDMPETTILGVGEPLFELGEEHIEGLDDDLPPAPPSDSSWFD